MPEPSPYARIYAIVRRIPHGRVATYGQIAAIDGRCSARQVGYAMAALREADVPWQRVVNAGGRVSERRGGGGTGPQRRLLEGEGVFFDSAGRIDFDAFGWDGPDLEWLERHGFEPAPRPANPRGARRRGPR